VDYPIQILNWHDQETPPSLAGGLERFPGAVCGGIRREETLVFGSPDQVQFEAHMALQDTGGRRLILGTGCVAPVITPYGNLMAARTAFEGT
jgi:uroporphyrinogen decarboxylase